ncbi:hypothetical protein [Streptomyces sp. NPDC056948]|uniref:hypothetical protein n=1 Tax=Streptomyces sp. NPDC056948 TaxID=3345975 RepID=UPI0036417607
MRKVVRREAVLVELASETPGAEIRELDDTAALRSERDVAVDAAQGVDVAHRRVEYFVPIPGSTPDQYYSNGGQAGQVLVRLSNVE